MKFGTVSASAEVTQSSALKVVITGHVDHGKSTLIGRLFYETDSLPEGRYEAIKGMCEHRGMPFEWAFLMDAFQSERDQGITIDTAQIWFRLKEKKFVIVDAPGHREFVKNMITGAANADAAMLLIDASQGIEQQSRYHGYLLNLLGVRQVIVVINKMDLVSFDCLRFEDIARKISSYLQGLGIDALHILPLSAREGDNFKTASPHMPWYRGVTLLEALETLAPVPSLNHLPLRFPIQDVYKFDDRRILAGRIESGSLKVGDTLLFSPGNKAAEIASLEAWHVPNAPKEAAAGQSIGITLKTPIFVERGAIASHLSEPPIETHVFRGRIFWLGQESLRSGQIWQLRLANREVKVTVEQIEAVHDVDAVASRAEDAVPRHGIADVIFRSSALLALDPATAILPTGRFVLTDGEVIQGGGLIDMRGYPNQRQFNRRESSNLSAVAHRVTAAMRTERNGHKGGVLWLTGLSAAGKSTIAMQAEMYLHAKGYQVYVLDGDNVRQGLNANLGFSPEDRAENIRRVGEVAALFADAGVITIVSFISPYRDDRVRARAAAPHGSFHEVYIEADLATCEARDPKGLYLRARRGDIAEFTGITAPYEVPLAAELTINTANQTIEESISVFVGYVERHFSLRKT